MVRSGDYYLFETDSEEEEDEKKEEDEEKEKEHPEKSAFQVFILPAQGIQALNWENMNGYKNTPQSLKAAKIFSFIISSHL